MTVYQRKSKFIATQKNQSPALEHEFEGLRSHWNQHDLGVLPFDFFRMMGRTDGTAPGAGEVGERKVSTVANGNTGTSGQFFDLTSIALTKGVWSAHGVVYYLRGGATFTSTDLELGIWQTPGNSVTGISVGDNYVVNQDCIPVTFSRHSLTLSDVLINISSDTTYYLKGYNSVYTVGQPTYYCRFSAIRIA